MKYAPSVWSEAGGRRGLGGAGSGWGRGRQGAAGGSIRGLMKRSAMVFSVLLSGLAACSQPPPEPPAFEIPDEIVPDWVNTVDPDTIFSAQSGCQLAVGGGVRVLQVLEGTAAHGALRAGDVITSVDGAAVSSREMLLRELADRLVGSGVTIGGDRLGEPFSVNLVLTPVSSEPDRAVLGVIPETKLAAEPPSGLPAEPGGADPFSRPVILDGRIYLHGPLAASWSPYPGAPADQVAALGPDLYAAAADPLSLVKVGGGGSISIDPGPVVLDRPGGRFEVMVSGFEGALTSVGDLVLAAGEVSTGTGDGGVSALIAVDPAERSVAWIRVLRLSRDDLPLAAVQGYRSPSGGQALITLVERGPDGNARPGVWSYYLIDEQGEGVVGPPGVEDFYRNSGVNGWYDEQSILYLADFEIPQIILWDIETGEHTPLRPVDSEATADLSTVSPVGDGRHVVQIREREVSLIDVELPEPARPISRGCRHEPVGGTPVG